MNISKYDNNAKIYLCTLIIKYIKKVDYFEKKCISFFGKVKSKLDIVLIGLPNSKANTNPPHIAKFCVKKFVFFIKITPFEKSPYLL